MSPRHEVLAQSSQGNKSTTTNLAAPGTIGGTTPGVVYATNTITPYALDTGSANALAITVNGFPATIQTGLSVYFKAANSSTGATTLTVTPSGQSAYATINLMKRVTAGVANIGASGDIVNGGIYQATYDGTQWVLSTPSSTTYTGGAVNAGTMVRGNGSNQVQGSTGIIATGGTVFTTYNSETVTAPGIPYIRAAISQKAETQAADLTLLTLTPAAAAGTYRVNVVASVSAATSGVIQFAIGYTDSTGNAWVGTGINIVNSTASGSATAITVTGVNVLCGSFIFDVDNSASTITIKWIGGGTSTTAKVSAIIERIL